MGLGCFEQLSVTGYCGNCAENHKTTEDLERDLKAIQEELDKRYLREAYESSYTKFND